ncbi:Cro/CI family transcriptional regulator [Enterobacter ludwigii]|uniref:Cro/CI family transcriptional regulator n=1 Tax=Enterobacter ludwigii TaxID=299767 RepID=UPI003BEF2FB3
MLKSDAVIFFGTHIRIAEAAGVERSAVSQWKELVPERCARRLEEASGGALHFDKDIYDRLKASRRKSRRKPGNNTPGAEGEPEQ